MKFDKGILLIDAMLALLLVMVLASITFNFIDFYCRFDKLLSNEELYEEESRYDID